MQRITTGRLPRILVKAKVFVYTSPKAKERKPVKNMTYSPLDEMVLRIFELQ